MATQEVGEGGVRHNWHMSTNRALILSIPDLSIQMFSSLLLWGLAGFDTNALRIPNKHVRSYELDIRCNVISLGQMNTSIHILAFISDQRNPPPSTPRLFWITVVISCSGSKRQNKCVISLPVVALRLSLQAIYPSMWRGLNQQLSQSDWFKADTTVWLSVHILTHAYEIWKKPLFCAVCSWRQCLKKCMKADIDLLRWDYLGKE